MNAKKVIEVLEELLTKEDLGLLEQELEVLTPEKKEKKKQERKKKRKEQELKEKKWQKQKEQEREKELKDLNSQEQEKKKKEWEEQDDQQKELKKKKREEQEKEEQEPKECFVEKQEDEDEKPTVTEEFNNPRKALKALDDALDGNTTIIDEQKEFLASDTSELNKEDKDTVEAIARIAKAAFVTDSNGDLDKDRLAWLREMLLYIKGQGNDKAGREINRLSGLLKEKKPLIFTQKGARNYLLAHDIMFDPYTIHRVLFKVLHDKKLQRDLVKIDFKKGGAAKEMLKAVKNSTRESAVGDEVSVELTISIKQIEEELNKELVSTESLYKKTNKARFFRGGAKQIENKFPAAAKKIDTIAKTPITKDREKLAKKLYKKISALSKEERKNTNIGAFEEIISNVPELYLEYIKKEVKANKISVESEKEVAQVISAYGQQVLKKFIITILKSDKEITEDSLKQILTITYPAALSKAITKAAKKTKATRWAIFRVLLKAITEHKAKHGTTNKTAEPNFEVTSPWLTEVADKDKKDRKTVVCTMLANMGGYSTTTYEEKTRRLIKAFEAIHKQGELRGKEGEITNKEIYRLGDILPEGTNPSDTEILTAFKETFSVDLSKNPVEQQRAVIKLLKHYRYAKKECHKSLNELNGITESTSDARIGKKRYLSHNVVAFVGRINTLEEFQQILDWERGIANPKAVVTALKRFAENAKKKDAEVSKFVTTQPKEASPTIPEDNDVEDLFFEEEEAKKVNDSDKNIIAEIALYAAKKGKGSDEEEKRKNGMAYLNEALNAMGTPVTEELTIELLQTLRTAKDNSLAPSKPLQKEEIDRDEQKEEDNTKKTIDNPTEVRKALETIRVENLTPEAWKNRDNPAQVKETLKAHGVQTEGLTAEDQEVVANVIKVALETEDPKGVLTPLVKEQDDTKFVENIQKFIAGGEKNKEQVAETQPPADALTEIDHPKDVFNGLQTLLSHINGLTPEEVEVMRKELKKAIEENTLNEVLKKYEIETGVLSPNDQRAIASTFAHVLTKGEGETGEEKQKNGTDWSRIRLKACNSKTGKGITLLAKDAEKAKINTLNAALAQRQTKGAIGRLVQGIDDKLKDRPVLKGILLVLALALVGVLIGGIFFLNFQTFGGVSQLLGVTGFWTVATGLAMAAAMHFVPPTMYKNISENKLIKAYTTFKENYPLVVPILKIAVGITAAVFFGIYIDDFLALPTVFFEPVTALSRVIPIGFAAAVGLSSGAADVHKHFRSEKQQVKDTTDRRPKSLTAGQKKELRQGNGQKTSVTQMLSSLCCCVQTNIPASDTRVNKRRGYNPLKVSKKKEEVKKPTSLKPVTM